MHPVTDNGYFYGGEFYLLGSVVEMGVVDQGYFRFGNIFIPVSAVLDKKQIINQFFNEEEKTKQARG